MCRQGMPCHPSICATGTLEIYGPLQCRVTAPSSSAEPPESVVEGSYGMSEGSSPGETPAARSLASRRLPCSRTGHPPLGAPPPQPTWQWTGRHALVRCVILAGIAILVAGIATNSNQCQHCAETRTLSRHAEECNSSNSNSNFKDKTFLSVCTQLQAQPS